MTEEHNVQTLLQLATDSLIAIDSARLDAEILLQNILNCERGFFYAHPEGIITPEQQQSFLELVQQRVKGMPIAYLTGEKEFWSLKLRVNEATLIPRPETELLVEQALSLIPEKSEQLVLDLGTGTGAIALAIAKERPHANLIATDISKQALDLARENAHLNEINNIEFILSNWFTNIIDKRFDLIIANPPYIAIGDEHLIRGDIRFEPKQALVSGKDGLDDINIIIQKASHFLKDNSHLMLEHGFEQGDKVESIFKNNGYKNIVPLYDLTGHHRSTMAKHSI